MRHLPEDLNDQEFGPRSLDCTHRFHRAAWMSCGVGRAAGVSDVPCEAARRAEDVRRRAH